MRNLFFVLTIILLAVSCKDDSVFHQYEDLTQSWHKDSAVVFKFEYPDTTAAHDLFITLRNTNEYAFSNLFLITEMQFPHGRTVKDTLEYEMAKPDGTWLGSGFGDIRDNKLWYKEGVRFNEEGTYTFKVWQAMRRGQDVVPVTTLEGVRSVGLRIEESKELRNE